MLSIAAADLLAEIRRRLPGRAHPFIVALDGPSGAGKTTLAAPIAEALGAALIPSDDFYAAEIPNAAWDARDPAQRAADAIDWRRLRRDALEPLLAGRPARWHAFDWDAGQRPDGTWPLQAQATERPPAAVIVLDGAYSTRPELADLIDLSVLVDVPLAVRHARLAAREAAGFMADWHARWDAAEQYYFTQVRPPESFDVIVNDDSTITVRGR